MRIFTCMTRKHFTTVEVAEMFSTEPAAVRKWIREGRLAAVNIGHRRRPIYRVLDAEIIRFEEANSSKASPAA